MQRAKVENQYSKPIAQKNVKCHMFLNKGQGILNKGQRSMNKLMFKVKGQ